MHNNHYFLKALSRSLEKLLIGERLLSCYTQDKDELILVFSGAAKEFIIRAHLQPAFSCLYFPEELMRARKNTVDLFPEITGDTVNQVHCHKNERAFSLRFSNELTLSFKMFGNRSNIILFRQDSPVRVFRSRLSQDLELSLSELDRDLEFGRDQFEDVSGNPGRFLPTLGKEAKDYLLQRGYNDLNMDERYAQIMELKTELERASVFYLVQWNGAPTLSLVPIGQLRQTYDDPVVALNNFFLAYQREGQLEREKTAAKDVLMKELERSRRYVEKNELRLITLENDTNYRIVADLIMANLHNIRSGEKEVRLADLYHPEKIHTIRLKPELSPQKNAESYYRKAKNQHLETGRLAENIAARRKKMEEMSQMMENIDAAETLRELRNVVGKAQPAGDKTDEGTPYHIFEWNGFKVWLGKNGKANDSLLRNAHKDDLWLHAKDVAGAHVLIRQSPGAGFPEPLKEKAASLAAFHSKGKNDSFCPVIVTPRKFVRKRKGAPPGEVVVDREEEVLIVAPANWD